MVSMSKHTITNFEDTIIYSSRCIAPLYYQFCQIKMFFEIFPVSFFLSSKWLFPIHRGTKILTFKEYLWLILIYFIHLPPCFYNVKKTRWDLPSKKNSFRKYLALWNDFFPQMGTQRIQKNLRWIVIVKIRENMNMWPSTWQTYL